MKNLYHIDATGILFEKQGLEIAGWLIPREQEEISFQVLIDGKQVPFVVQRVEREDVIKTIRSAKSVFGFCITIENVIKNIHESLQLLAMNNGEKMELLSINRSEIDQQIEKQLLKYNIDVIEKKEILTERTIIGWAVIKNPEDELCIELKTKKGENIPCSISVVERPDLVVHGIVNKENMKSGFAITYSEEYKDIYIEFTTHNSNLKERVSIAATERAIKWRKFKIALKKMLKKVNKKNMISLVKYISKHGFKNLKQKIKYAINNTVSFQDWYMWNKPTKEELENQRHTKFEQEYVFSIIVPLYNTPENFLREMIDSVIQQTYGKWELCLADGSDAEHEFVGDICKGYAQKDARIKYKKLEKNMGISENTNAALTMATGEYIGLFDHDDLLHPSVLYEYMNVICEKNADFIYCDELTFVETLNHITILHFKPDFAIDNLRANNYICHFSVFKKTLLDKVGGFRKEFDGSQDHDMIFRLTEQAKIICHIPKVLYFWRSHKGSVAGDISSKTYAIEAGIKAVKSHLQRCGLNAEIESSRISPSMYRIRYELTDRPLISILIPNMDHVEDLSRCIQSILTKSTYENYEIIIIENNSVKNETFEYYKELEKNSKIRIITYESNGEFNYSAVNNFAVPFAKGEHLLFLNNDIEIIAENWMEEMLMFSQREDIGAVGAKLYYPNDTIQHAGVILGAGGIAGHAHLFLPYDTPGYMGRCCLQQNFSIVTAACLMLKKKAFEQVGGFDDIKLKVAFNDVDLCMKLRKAGYLNAWTPYAEAYHYESVSRGVEDTPEKIERFMGEIASFEERWADELQAKDPYYNINFSTERADFTVKMQGL